jgi:hypothetical protein
MTASGFRSSWPRGAGNSSFELIGADALFDRPLLHAVHYFEFRCFSTDAHVEVCVGLS